MTSNRQSSSFGRNRVLIVSLIVSGLIALIILRSQRTIDPATLGLDLLARVRPIQEQNGPWKAVNAAWPDNDQLLAPGLSDAGSFVVSKCLDDLENELATAESAGESLWKSSPFHELIENAADRGVLVAQTFIEAGGLYQRGGIPDPTATDLDSLDQRLNTWATVLRAARMRAEIFDDPTTVNSIVRVEWAEVVDRFGAFWSTQKSGFEYFLLLHRTAALMDDTTRLLASGLIDPSLEEVARLVAELPCARDWWPLLVRAEYTEFRQRLIDPKLRSELGQRLAEEGWGGFSDRLLGEIRANDWSGIDIPRAVGLAGKIAESVLELDWVSLRGTDLWPETGFLSKLLGKEPSDDLVRHLFEGVLRIYGRRGAIYSYQATWERLLFSISHRAATLEGRTGVDSLESVIAGIPVDIELCQDFGAYWVIEAGVIDRTGPGDGDWRPARTWRVPADRRWMSHDFDGVVLFPTD